MADLDFLTRRSVGDGHLSGYRVLVLADSTVLEPAAAKTIESWVRSGGTLLAADSAGEVVGSRLYDHSAWRKRILVDAPAGGEIAALSACAARHRRTGCSRSAPTKTNAGWRATGTAASRREWPEIAGATMRWSGAKCGLLLPAARDRSHPAIEPFRAASGAWHERNRLGANGQPLAVIRRAGKQELELRVPASLLGPRMLMRLEFSLAAWQPSHHHPGSGDRRWLGFSLRQVEIVRHGTNDPPAPAELAMAVDHKPLEAATRAVALGRTVYLKGCGAEEIGAVLASLLGTSVDGRLDGRFATVTSDGVLWLDQNPPRIWAESGGGR